MERRASRPSRRAGTPGAPPARSSRKRQTSRGHGTSASRRGCCGAFVGRPGPRCWRWKRNVSCRLPGCFSATRHGSGFGLCLLFGGTARRIFVLPSSIPRDRGCRFFREQVPGVSGNRIGRDARERFAIALTVFVLGVFVLTVGALSVAIAMVFVVNIVGLRKMLGQTKLCRGITGLGVFDDLRRAGCFFQRGPEAGLVSCSWSGRATRCGWRHPVCQKCGRGSS